MSGFYVAQGEGLSFLKLSRRLLLMPAIALNSDHILGRINPSSFGEVIFVEAHRMVALGEEL